MPSKSPAQARLMRAVAHGWDKPGGGGPTRAVAKEFVNADRRKKVTGYQFGGPAQYRGVQGMGQKPMGPLSRDPRAMPPNMPPGGSRGMPPMGGFPSPGGRPPGMLPGAGRGAQPMQRGMPGGPSGIDPRRGGIPGQAGGGGRPGGALSQIMLQMQGQAGGMMPPGRMPPGRIPGNQARPGYPGGGNPMMGGRNPMLRGRGQYMP